MTVVDWFSGRGRLPGATDEVGPWNRGIELVEAAEQYSEAGRNLAVVQAMAQAMVMKPTVKDELVRDLNSQLAELAARINELRDELEGENQ